MRLKNKILESEVCEIGGAIRILSLTLAVDIIKRLRRVEWKYEENINTNMCEHVQNFHALDVAFIRFFAPFKDLFICFSFSFVYDSLPVFYDFCCDI